MRIIFIHGLGCSASSFLELAAHLEMKLTNDTILSLEFICLPKNSVSSEKILQFEEIAEHIAHSVSESDEILVIAHSMGSAIAVPLAELIENNLHGLVLIEGNLLDDDCESFSRRLMNYAEKEYDDEFLQMVQKMEGVGWIQWRDDILSYDRETLANYAKQLVKISDDGTLLPRFCELEAIKLFLYGEDYIGDGKTEPRKVLSLLPEEVLKEIPVSNHFIMQEYPKLCAYYIAELVSQNKE